MDKFLEAIIDLWESSGLAQLCNFANGGWKNLIMIAVACVLLFLAIKKQFEPLLLLPIAFGMLLVNLPLGGVMAQVRALNCLPYTGCSVHTPSKVTFSPGLSSGIMPTMVCCVLPTPARKTV